MQRSPDGNEIAGLTDNLKCFTQVVHFFGACIKHSVEYVVLSGCRLGDDDNSLSAEQVRNRPRVSHRAPTASHRSSNVPGPKEHLYLRGARLEATYPVSIPGHSMALNITAHSYAGTLDLGFIGDREALPHLQRLAVRAGEALEELEAAVAGLD